MAKSFFLNIVALLLGLSLAFGLSEGLLRVCGFRPWVYSTKDTNEPTMHEPDSVLGWRNKTGSYIVPPYDPSGQTVQITFLENGRRRTGLNTSLSSAGELVVVGDSFTQGWAISDSETYTWKLQEKFPFFQVLNYGTGGYGSYQSLLVLERELPHLARPRFVLYGFNEFHEARNVAPGWLLANFASYSHRAHVYVPFTTYDSRNGMLRHPPERYLSLPFRESSALVTFIEKSYMDFTTRERALQKMVVTKQILLQMNKVCSEHQAIFVVILLSVSDQTKEHYVKFLSENNIQVIDCVYDLTKEMKVPGEGHPNGYMNTLWAECISEALANQIENSRPSDSLTQSTH
jgi:hypothetical protein